MRRSRLCVFFLSSPRGGRGNRALSEREIFFCARKGGNLASSFFAPRCERRSRDFREDLRFVGIRSRERVEFCAREEERWMVPKRVYESTKGREGVTQRGFSLFFLLLVFHFSLTRKLFLLKKHSHRKRRLKSRRSWARSKSKTARSRNGFA